MSSFSFFFSNILSHNERFVKTSRVGLLSKARGGKKEIKFFAQSS